MRPLGTHNSNYKRRSGSIKFKGRRKGDLQMSDKEIIESEFNIKYADYESDALFCFFTFLKRQDQAGVDKLKAFISRYGNQVIKIFSIFNNNHDKTFNYLL
jgi:hypothetical protein